MVRRPSVVRRPSFRMLKHLLLRNRLANQSQILCGASLGRGNEILLAASGSHDQDGCHAHIWSKPFKILLLQNRWADFHETWYVASGSHDQDGCHAHIWSKPFKILLLQNRWADFHETWYVASGTPANHSLFK